MSNWTNETVQGAVNAVIEKAGNDEQFRALCKSNIHAAIKEVSGKEIPSNFKINVVDNVGYHISVTLPALQKADGELGESELESVAGGSKDHEYRPEMRLCVEPPDQPDQLVKLVGMPNPFSK